MIHHGMNLRKFEKEFRRLGGQIEEREKHGERFYSHPMFPGRRVMVNIRRKDTARCLTSLGIDVEKGAA